MSLGDMQHNISGKIWPIFECVFEKKRRKLNFVEERRNILRIPASFSFLFVQSLLFLRELSHLLVSPRFDICLFPIRSDDSHETAASTGPTRTFTRPPGVNLFVTERKRKKERKKLRKREKKNVLLFLLSSEKRGRERKGTWDMNVRGTTDLGICGVEFFGNFVYYCSFVDGKLSWKYFIVKDV